MPLYRGDKLSNLYDRLGLFYNHRNLDYKQLLSRLFMVGDKSRSFYADEFFEPAQGRQIKIDDCTANVYNYIFDNINSSIKSKNIHTKSFFNKNEKFKDYFLNKAANKMAFTSGISSLDKNDQVYFKNYYLVLLHQLGSINYKASSHFVSTSTDSTVAGRFAGDNYYSKKVMLHSWMPINSQGKIFNKLKLPKYIGKPYSNQKEVSVLAGILPHYIIGLEIIDDEKFFINPNIFINLIDNNLFINGLDIDQGDFDDVIKLTKYKDSFEVRGNKVIQRP